MDANDYAKSIQTMSLRYIEEYTRSVQRYADLINNISRPENKSSQGTDFGSAEQQIRHNEFLLNETPGVLSRIVDASIQYYSALNDLSIHTINRYFDQVVQIESGQNIREEVTSTKSATKLIFHGVSDETSSNAFLVSNQRNVEINVSFDCSDVTSEDGKSQFKPKAQFTPAKCRLGPNGEQVVQCSLLLSRLFKPGQRYQGSILVVGFPDMAMPFSVDVEPAVNKASKKKPLRKKTAARKKSKKI